SLGRTSGAISCRVCDRSYPVEDGIPSFARDHDFYYGEIPRDVMESLLAGPSDRALADQLRERSNSRWLHYYALARERCLLKYFVDARAGTQVLDLGAGWGNISLAMAE